MDTQVQKALEDSLDFVEVNINLLRSALSKTLVSDSKTLGNERASLVILKSIDMLESITLSLEEIGQPIENELEKAAKELYINLQDSLDSCISISDASTKGKFQEIREILKKIEREHQERKHSKDKAGTLRPTGLCETSLC
ncbi:MAG: hypothetical protein KME27_08435 [Lyngbya sp. HA4199-MV5]|jgi:predicted DNA-binding ArsR family transcriptional regulator|nr:hypothetical protein [Lyngbya sp. HA4199-MV5]